MQRFYGLADRIRSRLFAWLRRGDRSGPVPSSPDMSKVVHDDTGAPLVCYGCGHSAGWEPYPSHPSGERPCGFCTRNPQQAKQLEYIRSRQLPGTAFTARYDNGPTRKEPADQYIATDRLLRDIEPGGHVIT